MISSSDVVDRNAIEQADYSGDVIIDGNKLYVPTAYGYYQRW